MVAAVAIADDAAEPALRLAHEVHAAAQREIRDIPLLSYNKFAQDGAPFSVLPPMPEASNDPFFVIGGQRTKFWLPVAERTPLLRLNGTSGEAITLFGTTFGDDRASQWFREYEFTVNRRSKVRIQVGPPDKRGPNSLRTLQLWINRVPFMSNHQDEIHAGQGVEVRTRELPVKKIGDMPAEEVSITSSLLNVTVWSAAATKFAGPAKQLKFAHLNVDLSWAKVGTGLLSELAGDVPLRKSSKMLITPLETVMGGAKSLGITQLRLVHRSLNSSDPDEMSQTPSAPSDLLCYVKRYPDLLAAFCGDGLAHCDWKQARRHADTSGRAEGRTLGCTFNLST